MTRTATSTETDGQARSGGDTIAAIATAPGEASVSIVRISGPDALAVADRIFRPAPSTLRDRSVTYGHAVAADQQIDEALCVVMRAPRSYTREDVVEIQGHGGHQMARAVLRGCVAAGARLAEPGEFTKRAFLNGRLDLVQAEAVLDVIRARSDRAAAAAMEQLSGRLSRVFDDLYDRVLLQTARIEATLDFPEDELPETVIPELLAALGQDLSRLEHLLAQWDEGHWLRDGVLVVISGKPNVGKSTLLNALLQRDRAIVTEVPGTTRDAIEESLVIGGVPIRLMDTAGLRETDETVERIGIDRARAAVAEADFHILVLDASETDLSPSPESEYHLDRTIVVLNKIDLVDRGDPPRAPYPASVAASLKFGQGIDEIRGALRELISARVDLEARPHAVISERHRELLVHTKSLLQQVVVHLESGRDEELFLAAAAAREGLETLGQVTGRTFQEELLDRIFSDFCIGK